MMRLKTISLLREQVQGWNEYPFSIPAIKSLRDLQITSRICFFVGENGTGKSTLLEAVAAHYGFGLEGGNRNFSPRTTTSVSSIEPLVKALRLSFTKRTGGGFYLRAESFFTLLVMLMGWAHQKAMVAGASTINHMESHSFPYSRIVLLGRAST